MELNPDLLADLADLFAIEALDAHSHGDTVECERLMGIATELFERVLNLPSKTLSEAL